MRPRRYPRVGVCRASRVSFRGKARACILTSHDSRNAMGTPGETKRNERRLAALSDDDDDDDDGRPGRRRAIDAKERAIDPFARSFASIVRSFSAQREEHPRREFEPFEPFARAFVEKCHRKRGRGVDRTRRRRRRNRNRNRNRREMCLTINHRRARRNVKERGPEEEEATTTTTKPTARRGRSEAE